MNLYNLCEAFHCLPDKGGLLDQDPYIIRWFIAVGNAKGSRSKMDQAFADLGKKEGGGR